MTVGDALDRAWSDAPDPGSALAAVEQEVWALRYAVLVVDRSADGPADEVGRKLVRAAVAMRGPGSPPMALIAAGRFDDTPLERPPEALVLWRSPAADDEGPCAMVCLAPAG
jgi:hypothetical protein